MYAHIEADNRFVLKKSLWICYILSLLAIQYESKPILHKPLIRSHLIDDSVLVILY